MTAGLIALLAVGIVAAGWVLTLLGLEVGDRIRRRHD